MTDRLAIIAAIPTRAALQQWVRGRTLTQAEELAVARRQIELREKENAK